MAKLSEKYEALVVLNTKLGEEGVQALVTKLTDLITNNATMDQVDEWGKRRLAYPIMDETEGYYVLFNFTCESSFPAELDRVLKITDGILRSLITVRVGELKPIAPKPEAKPAEAPAAETVAETAAPAEAPAASDAEPETAAPAAE